MPIDVSDAAAFLASVSPELPQVPGAPGRDLARSPAARRVGELAADAGLALFHFEHRTTLELPDAWIAPGRDDDARPPTWVDGALPESKYQSFRHDLYLGSFHPGHRGKWTTHELCHGLVGTAWRPDATALFHATAARLAELLPVVLWYFLDECALRRCPDHAGDGALFRAWCPACEAIAGEGWEDVEERWLVGARDFLDRELAAIARSRRLGRPVPHRWATIDLASDGVAYAAAHGRRLSSPAFHRFAERFGVGFRTLDDLEERVVVVARAICGGGALSGGGSGSAEPSEAGSGRAGGARSGGAGATETGGEAIPAETGSGRAGGASTGAALAGGGSRAAEPTEAEVDRVAGDRWVAQDLAWRLLQLAEDTEGEAVRGLHALVDDLADGRGPEHAIDGYLALFEDYHLPEPEHVFAVGYDLPRGLGRSVAQVADGLRTVCPLTMELVEDAGLDWVAGFVAADRPERRPLGARFASWLATHAEGPVAELAAYEAALRSVRPDGLAGSLDDAALDGRYVLARGALAMTATRDLTALAHAVDAGEVQGRAEGDRLELEGDVPPDAPTGLLIGRAAEGEVVVVEVPVEASRALQQGEIDGLTDEERTLLREVGLLVPEAWRLDR